ncbi:MAG: hypothetical protein AAF492_08710, partial [Verrucomicrobiota bacterium]
ATSGIPRMPCGCPLPPPPGGNDETDLPVKLDGCPKAPKNPLFDVDPDDDVRMTLSYGVLDFSLAGFEIMEEHDKWVFACSDFESIAATNELAFKRHRDSVNVFFFDAHVDRIQEEHMPFPE